jgi:hypothetical protein
MTSSFMGAVLLKQGQRLFEQMKLAIPHFRAVADTLEIQEILGNLKDN